jgi:CDP-glycerol glycerophosphotransferase (TagB/SpsB family)
MIEDNSSTLEQKHDEVAGKIHNSLRGNQDYIDSNIVLGENKEDDTCIVFFSANDVKDKEYIRKKAHEAIDIYIDSLVKDNA